MATTQLTETIDSLWSSTWPHFKPEVIDAVFLERYPLFYWLSQRNRVQFISGGRDIRFPLETDINPTVTELPRGGTVSLEDVDPFTTCIYQWGTIAGNINRYRDDDLENASRERIFNLLQKKVNNLKKSKRKKFERDFFRAEDSKPAAGFNSLLDLVASNPTSSKTVGNFDQSSHEWWRNQQRAASGPAATWLRKDMQQLFYDIEDDEEAPDLIIAPRDAYGIYEDDLLGMSNFTNKELADAGFDHLVYRSKPIIRMPHCPSTQLLMINAEYLYLVLHRNMNFEMTDWKEAVNKPFDRSAQIVTKGQLIATNRRAAGTLTSITY